MEKLAEISEDGIYRYSLERWWGEKLEKKNPLVFCMLNPSTADAENDDPTIRRCIGFARREGRNGIIVVNVFALRATDPKEIQACRDRGGDPVGLENYSFLSEVAKKYKEVVLAWGAHKAKEASRAAEIFYNYGAKTMCLGKTKHDLPRHPLYVRADQPLLRY